MTEKKESDLKEPDLEELFTQMEEILEKMEDKDISLEDSFSLYEEGMKKLAQCNAKIDDVEKKMLVISNQGTFEEFE